MNSMVERLTSADKLFHSYIRYEDCSSLGPLISEHGRIVSDASDMSNLLADAFSSSFCRGC